MDDNDIVYEDFSDFPKRINTPKKEEKVRDINISLNPIFL